MPYLLLDPGEAEAAVATSVDLPLTTGVMNFGELTAELRARMLGRVDIDPERFGLYVNLAYVDLATSLRLDELKGSILVPLVEDQPFYLLPPAVFAIIHASLSLTTSPQIGLRGRPLEKTSEDRYVRAPIKEGWPKEYFRLNRMLVVYPTPKESNNGELSIIFRIRPKFLTQQTDYPLLGGEWHEALLVLAEQKTLEAVQEWEAAGIVENAFVKLMRKRIDPAALEDDTKVMKSSVPRDNIRLARRRRGSFWTDGLD